MGNRVVLQHMSINLEEHVDLDVPEDEHEENKENDEPSAGGLLAAVAADIETNNNPCSQPASMTTSNAKMAEKQKAPPPFGLSPPSESKLLQRRTKQSQSLNYSCRVKSGITKNSNSFVNVADLVSNIVESPVC